MRRQVAVLCFLAFFVIATIPAQESDSQSSGLGLAFVAMPVANIPVLDAFGVFGLGPGAHVSVWYPLFGIPMSADLTISYSLTPALDQNASISTIAGSLGAFYDLQMGRFAARVGGRVSYGYSTLSWDGDLGSATAIGWWGVAGAEFALTNNWAVAVEASLTAHSNTYVGLEAGLGAVFRPFAGENRPALRVQPQPVRPEPTIDVTDADEPEERQETERGKAVAVREEVENTRADLQLLAAGFDVVFPVFYRFYDDNPIGIATLKNQSNRTISNIELIVNIPRFMDVAQKQNVPDELRAGEQIEIPLSVLFNDELLRVTEGTRVQGQFEVAYNIGNSPQEYVVDAPLNVADRNAMTWDDDQKAASFVTAKDPSVLTFAKNVSSVVRSVGYSTINAPLRTGMAMLEAMALHGINYVVDPTSPYEQFSDQPFAIDFLQFPRQTFQFRAGDCDDLAICYASNLQAVGVSAAFITIPGHLYSAFSTGLSEEEARGTFGRFDDLIIVDGEAWIPVETTLLQDGFLEAWKIGARQWRENAGRDQARLIPVESAWNVYEPVGFDVETVSIPTPDVSDLEREYTLQLNAFIGQEIGPQVARLEARIQASGDPKQVNRLGVVYARYGMFDEAEVQFRTALEEGPQADAFLNLGNIEFLRGNFEEAADLFDKAKDLEPDSALVLLAIAKANHELENYGTAERAYENLQVVAPAIAADFEYLQFRGSDAARASDAAVQKNIILWGEEEE